ncbi:Transglutaminase-like superfamily protein [Actinobacteria bacterium IMCC26207]|nr:Transglutaminase-like superfamily protein [Actinobacteria bacterium IMCC26207]
MRPQSSPGAPAAQGDGSSRRPDSVAACAAELGLLALALGTAASFLRLFDTWSFVSELAIALVTPWLLALTLRRLRVGLGAALAAQLLAAVVLLTALFAPGSSRFLLPTPATARLLSSSISTSFTEFSQLVAPVPATKGFIVVIAVGFWLFISFADAAAFRFAGPAQAATPFLTTFLAIGLLSRDSARISSTACFLAGLLVFTVTQLTLRAARTRWDGLPHRSATAGFARSAVLIGSLAVIGGLLLGPAVAGATDPVVNLRQLGRGPEPRTVVSPFVGIRSLLGERSNEELFTVRADAPAYWRLTALEEFDADRDIWISRGTYQRSDGELPSNLGPTVSGTTLRQEIQISELTGLWLPGAYEPAQITTDTEVSFDRESSSIILVSPDSKLTPKYQLDSLIPDFAAAAQAQAGTKQELDPIYFEKSQSPAITPELLAQITANATTPFEQAIALQNWFRSEFRYDDTVDFSQSADPLAEFLQAAAGFCQQFSSAFALFARALGLGSRVAVGFTPGDPVGVANQPEQSGDAIREYQVRGRHAHAWPEIYFADLGWVPFEPTPGRGDPQTAPYTGVSAAQAVPPAAAAVGSTVPDNNGVTNNGAGVTTVAPTPSEDSSALPSPKPSPEADTSASTPNNSGTALKRFAIRLLLLILGLGILSGLIIWAARLLKQQKRRQGLQDLQEASDEEQSLLDALFVEDAWKRALLWLSLVDIRPTTFETPAEFAGRASNSLPANEDNPQATVLARTSLRSLANSETARRYGQIGESSHLGIKAQQAADSVEQLIRYSSSGRRSRSFAFVLASLK